jgi:predicted helicase
VKASKATNRHALGDPYVKFFRWAADRLQGRDGIVCYVSNNSFVDQLAFDGMRKHLAQDFAHIYHLDLHGNVRRNPKLSGSTHNIFGIQVGVGITLAIRKTQSAERLLHYFRVPEMWRRTEKLEFLAEKKSVSGIEWKLLQPDTRNTWLTEGMDIDFEAFMPIGTRDSKFGQKLELRSVFRMYTNGVKTNRDDWVYDFNSTSLREKIVRCIEEYNSEIDRWKRAERPDDVDNFVSYDDKKMKWSRDLKSDLKREKYARFDFSKMRFSLYRPFTIKCYFFDPILSQDIFLHPRFFPSTNDEENIAICLTDVGSEKPFMVQVTNIIPDLHLVGAGASTQCFPFYTYSEDGSNRRENQ